MPTNKEVVDVIEQWSGKRPGKMSQSLEDWWNQTAPGSTHSALSFNPDGIDDLLKRIQKAFPSSPVLVAGDFQAAGNIKTLQDLVDALQPVMADAVMDVPSQASVAVARQGRIQKKTQKKRSGRQRKISKGAKVSVAKKSGSREKVSRKLGRRSGKRRAGAAAGKVSGAKAKKK
jgi:hypothetical protein